MLNYAENRRTILPLACGGALMNPEEIEDLWRARLEEARQRHGSAALQCMKAREEYRGQNLPSPHGDFKFRQAIRQEDVAREDFLRILRIFTRLVLYGEAPPEQ